MAKKHVYQIEISTDYSYSSEPIKMEKLVEFAAAAISVSFTRLEIKKLRGPK